MHFPVVVATNLFNKRMKSLFDVYTRWSRIQLRTHCSFILSASIISLQNISSWSLKPSFLLVDISNKIRQVTELQNEQCIDALLAIRLQAAGTVSQKMLLGGICGNKIL